MLAQRAFCWHGTVPQRPTSSHPSQRGLCQQKPMVYMWPYFSGACLFIHFCKRPCDVEYSVAQCCSWTPASHSVYLLILAKPIKPCLLIHFPPASLHSMCCYGQCESVFLSRWNFHKCLSELRDLGSWDLLCVALSLIQGLQSCLYIDWSLVWVGNPHYIVCRQSEPNHPWYESTSPQFQWNKLIYTPVRIWCFMTGLTRENICMERLNP